MKLPTCISQNMYPIKQHMTTILIKSQGCKLEMVVEFRFSYLQSLFYDYCMKHSGILKVFRVLRWHVGQVTHRNKNGVGNTQF